MKYAGVIALGLALLFVGALIYGTYRRTEAFTTIRGNFPPFVEIQRTVRGMFDQYYDYDMSEFSKIEQTDVFNEGKTLIETMAPDIPVKFLIQDPAKLDQVVNDDRALKLIKELKTFMPKGFVPNLESMPVDTYMAVLHAARDWLSNKIQTYKKDDVFPIDQLILGSLALDAFTLSFKNAVIREYYAVAFTKSHPKPKKA
jgi:hypothetical protein